MCNAKPYITIRISNSHHGNLLNLQNPRGNGCIEQQRLLIFRAPQASSCREKKPIQRAGQRKISSLTPGFRFARRLKPQFYGIFQSL